VEVVVLLMGEVVALVDIEQLFQVLLVMQVLFQLQQQLFLLR
jgi:hypothetical protein